MSAESTTRMRNGLRMRTKAGGAADQTPLERAQQRAQMKSCPDCEDRVEIRGASYCRKDGKLLHPMLLDRRYPLRCPDEIKEARER